MYFPVIQHLSHRVFQSKLFAFSVFARVTNSSFNRFIKIHGVGWKLFFRLLTYNGKMYRFFFLDHLSRINRISPSSTICNWRMWNGIWKRWAARLPNKRCLIAWFFFRSPMTNTVRTRFSAHGVATATHYSQLNWINKLIIAIWRFDFVARFLETYRKWNVCVGWWVVSTELWWCDWISVQIVKKAIAHCRYIVRACRQT